MWSSWQSIKDHQHDPNLSQEIKHSPSRLYIYSSKRSAKSLNPKMNTLVDYRCASIIKNLHFSSFECLITVDVISLESLKAIYFSVIFLNSCIIPLTNLFTGEEYYYAHTQNMPTGHSQGTRRPKWLACSKLWWTNRCRQFTTYLLLSNSLYFLACKRLF